MYGIIIGKIFCGESMFSLEKNASKVALVYLAALLKQNDYKFIDTQFYSEHLKQFGTKKITKFEYKKILENNKYSQRIDFPNELKQSLLKFFK